MERHELNIPTIYSHSFFTDQKGMPMNLTKTQFDYFWAIVYLYKNKLLSIKQSGLTKLERDDKSIYHEINPNIIWDDTPIEIEFYEIKSLFKDENNSKYQSLRDFMGNFGKVHLKTNLFAKDLQPSQIVKPVKQLSITLDNLNLVLVLNDEFIKPLLLTSSFFKKVTLNFMFKLPSTKTKALYLIFKDYENFHKNFTKIEIESVAKDVFVSKKRIGDILNHINTITDINVTQERLKMRKLAHKYSVKSQLKFIDDEEEIEYYTKKLIRKEAEAKTKKVIESGMQIGSEEAYMRKIFGQIINDEEQYNIFTTKAIIDIFVKEKKKELSNMVDENISGYWYVCIDLETGSGVKSYAVDDNYLLREAIFPTYITKSVEETHSKIQSKVGCQTYFSNNEISGCLKSLIKLT